MKGITGALEQHGRDILAMLYIPNVHMREPMSSCESRPAKCECATRLPSSERRKLIERAPFLP